MVTIAYEFDVAISFANEDRQLAHEIAHCLIENDVRTFYDKEEVKKGTLWGKNGKAHFSDVFENKSRYCLVIFSQYYLHRSKKWTKIEWGAALRRQERQTPQEYILLLKLDNAKIPAGLSPDILYLPWEGDAKSVCETLLMKFPEYLIKVLKNDRKSLEIRARAAEVLGKLEDPIAIMPLIQALQYINEVKQRAADALINIGEPSVGLVIQHMTDEGQNTPRIIMEVLGKIGQPAILPLIEVLNNSNIYVRDYAGKALCKVGEPAVAPLIKVLNNRKSFAPFARSRAALSLGCIGDVRAVESLIELLHDEDRTARLGAARSLGDLEDPRAVVPLIQLVATIQIDTIAEINGTYDHSVLIHTVESLVHIGSSGMEPLVAALDNDYWLVRWAAVSALWKIKDPRAVESLIRASKDGNVEVRGVTAYALGELADSRAIEPLREMAEDENPEVKRTAIEALEKIIHKPLY